MGPNPSPSFLSEKIVNYFFCGCHLVRTKALGIQLLRLMHDVVVVAAVRSVFLVEALVVELVAFAGVQPDGHNLAAAGHGPKEEVSHCKEI